MNDFIVSLMLLGAVSNSGSYLPFWMTTNQYGLMPERNGALALLSAETQFDSSKTFQYRWGASLGVNAYNNPLAPDSSPCNVMLDQLYASLKWKVFTLDLGQKHREADFLGSWDQLGSLSVTAGHLVETGNARSMPGYLLSLDPIAIPLTNKHLWIYGAFGDYATTDVRYMQGALVHRTQIGFRWTPGPRLSFDALLDHYGIWAGESEKYGKMKINLANYFRVVTGSHAGKDGTLSDRINVIGDQGGSEIFRLRYRGDRWTFTFQHDIPYNDGSGMGFQNFPDGVNTLAISHIDKNRWVSDFVYEYHYTMYQSGPINGEQFDENGNCLTPPGTKTTGRDQYFWNGQYKSCWTHYGRIIGDPLILPSGIHEGTWTSAIMNISTENDRYIAHHIGLGGRLFRRHPYKLMLTYSDNHGSYHSGPYLGEDPKDKPWGTVKETGLKQVSASFTGAIKINAGGRRQISPRTPSHTALNLLYGLYADKGSLYDDSVGVTIGLRCSFF